MAALTQRFPEQHKKSRVLQLPWVRGWRGWQQATENLEEGVGDPPFYQEAIIFCVQQFRTDVLSKIAVISTSDEQRQDDLRAGGNTLGHGA